MFTHALRQRVVTQLLTHQPRGTMSQSIRSFHSASIRLASIPQASGIYSSSETLIQPKRTPFVSPITPTTIEEGMAASRPPPTSIESHVSLPENPTADDMARLRKEYGFVDPESADFKFEHMPVTGLHRALMWLGLALIVYHLSETVRNFTNQQIDSLQRWIKHQQAQQVKPGSTQSIVAVPDSQRASTKTNLFIETVKADAAPTNTTPPPSSTTTPAPLATTASAPTPTAAPTAPEQDTTVCQLMNALELVQLLRCKEKLDAFIAEERKAQAVAHAHPPIHTSDELPAKTALEAIQDAAVQLEIPVTFPTQPSWSSPPKSIEEARQRLAQLQQYRLDYEAAIQANLRDMKDQLAKKLPPALREIYDRARKEFDDQLPERLKQAEIATRNLLENQSLNELAEISRKITAQKAAEWSEIFPREMAKLKDSLEQQMKEVLNKQEKSINKEYDPSVSEQLKRLEAQRREIIALEKELGRKRQIEKTGERVHALTSLLIQIEENLQRDTKAQLFDAEGRAQQPFVEPGTWSTVELQNHWNRLVELSKPDPKLNQLVSSIPSSYLSSTSSTPLVTPSSLRHSFVNVERSIREATFLPPGEDVADETNPVAQLYAKVFATLSMKEGQALKANPVTDADRLNNATYYVQKERNLPGAIKELEALQSPKARAEADEWLQQAKQRVQVEATVWKVRQNIQETAKTYAKNVK